MKIAYAQFSRIWGWWPTGDFGPLTIYTSHVRAEPVAYLKAPPDKPPSWKQKIAQTDFRNAAHLWSALPTATKQAWLTAAKRAHLSISGFNFWMHVKIKNDVAAARTVQHQARIDLGV